VQRSPLLSHLNGVLQWAHSEVNRAWRTRHTVAATVAPAAHMVGLSGCRELAEAR